uniref:Uncharacterized protein n=1 Tax=viral metagenome TaxID=1070528 RepID=A0A6C0B0A2_9ZZZZ
MNSTFLKFIAVFLLITGSPFLLYSTVMSVTNEPSKKPLGVLGVTFLMIVTGIILVFKN